MNQHKIDLKKNKITDDNSLTIQLKFVVDVDSEAYDIDDGSFISGSQDSINGIYDKAKEFADTKVGKIKLDKSKSKILEIYEGDNGSNSYERILKIQPPKEIVNIITTVRERIPKE